MKKVLIINPYFPPLNAVAARRFGEMVQHMENYGWEPTVVTIHSKGALKVNIKDEKVIRVGQFNQASETQNKAKKIFLISDLKRRMGYLLNFRTIDRFLLNWNKQVINDPRVIEAAKSADVILASYKPTATFFIAKELSAKYNKKWIADFRDLGALYDEGKDKFPLFIDKLIEKRVIKSASAITTVSKGLAEALKKSYNKDIHVIYNGWEPVGASEQKVGIQENSVLHNKQYIYYAGTIYIHQLETFRMIIQALDKETVLVIRSLGLKEAEESLRDYVKTKQLEGKLLLLPPEAPEVIKQEADNALLNLVVEDLKMEFEWKKGVLTGKLFGLMTYDPPILAVAGDHSEIKEIIEETNKGYFASNVNQVAKIIQKVSSESHELVSDIAKYSKKNQAKRMCEILDSLMQ